MKSFIKKLLAMVGLKPKSEVEVLNQRISVLRKRTDIYSKQKATLSNKLETVQLELGRQSVRSTFYKSICNGSSLSDAILCQVRDGLKAKDRITIRAFIQSLDRNCDKNSELFNAITIAKALFLFNDSFFPQSFELFKKVNFDCIEKYAMYEYFYCWAEMGGGNIECDSLKKQVIKLIRAKRYDEALRLCEILVKTKNMKDFYKFVNQIASFCSELPKGLNDKLQWYLSRERESAPSALPTADINIGIIDYKMADKARSSANHGDYIQTLASISNYVRFSNLDFVSCDKNLEKFVKECQERISQSNKIVSPRKVVNLVKVDRDFSSNNFIPPNTWMLAFGWYQHPNFKSFYDFPFNPNLNPIFISFHINKIELLTVEAIEYLKKYAPIGCRDWNTVYILLSKGIDAFFSGCITTTIAQLYERFEITKNGKNRIAVVEADAPAGYSPDEYSTFSQTSPDVRDTDLAKSLQRADQMLQGYLPFSKVITHRLHCYLPCRALGLDVTFVPKNESDIRFEGLLHLSEDNFIKIRDGVRAKISEIFKAIFAQKSEIEVYTLWKEICTEDVAYAKDYFAKVVTPTLSNFDLNEIVKEVKEVCKKYNQNVLPDIHLAFATDKNLAENFPVVLESVVANTKKKLCVNVLTRGLSEEYFEKIANKFKEVNFVFFPFDSISYGEKVKLLKHISISTIDRLLLPEVLDCDKVLYLDIDIIVNDDIGDLYDMDLGNYALAGKSSNYIHLKTGYKLIYRASLSLAPQDAWDLRRKAHYEGELDFNAFNAGVVLMNLRKMRKDEFSSKYIPLVENYALNDQDALNLYCRDNRLEIAKQWNVIPSQENVLDAKLIHWAGPVKPWGSLYISRKEIFEKYKMIYSSR